MRAPLFWEDKTFISTALVPLASVYGWLAAVKTRSIVPEKLSVPVICVGNLVAGGAGKTPIALALGAMLKERGVAAHYLLRGYKGILDGPVRIDAGTHTVQEVGDEALLLAQMLPTWVAKDKIAGAKTAIQSGAQCIVLDDGFQNPVLQKDVSFLVVDGSHGFGNGRLIPAGPLREPVAMGIARASAVILVGEDTRNVLSHVPQGIPVLRARFKPTVQAYALKGKAVVAFAGIARPRKFYRTLQQLECVIKKMAAYPDHYTFTPKDIAFLRAKAKEYDAMLVTTTKDYVRLPADIRAEVTPVPIEAVFEDSAALLRLALPG